jgi:regulator of sigma D
VAKTENTTPDRRTQTKLLISKLLAERTEMLVLFCRAAGVEQLSDTTSTAHQTSEETVREFCQVLVDYVAAGHFTLYDRIAKGEERRQAVRDIAMRIYGQLEDTTQAALDFNDAYQLQAAARNHARLAQDLSQLGEKLAQRIELEDQLLATMDPDVGQEAE